MFVLEALYFVCYCAHTQGHVHMSCAIHIAANGSYFSTDLQVTVTRKKAALKTKKAETQTQ